MLGWIVGWSDVDIGGKGKGVQVRSWPTDPRCPRNYILASQALRVGIGNKNRWDTLGCRWEHARLDNGSAGVTVQRQTLELGN